MAETLVLDTSAVGSYLTSTGVAHSHPGKLVQQQPLQWRYLKDLPPGLLAGAKCRPLTLGDVYTTTTCHAHHKHRERNMTTPTSWQELQHKRAPAHWKVHYTKHMIDKSADSSWSPALTMSNQSSEMKSQYQARPDDICSRLQDSSHGQPLPHTLRDHLNDQLTKELPASTVSKGAGGRGVLPSEGGVFHRTEPYLTTNHCYHRHFSSKELSGYPRNDVATYWQCEKYPKAWGFGMQDNPLDTEDVTGPREEVGGASPTNVPMRDRTVFATATKLPAVLLKSAKPVSSGGRSQYSDHYQRPPQSKTRKLFYCPVTPNPQVTKDRTLMNTVSHMYKSVNSSYGNPPTRL